MNKKNLIILTIAVVMILIITGVLYFIILKDKNDKSEQNGSSLNLEPAQEVKQNLTHYGKMSLQTDADPVLAGETFSVSIIMDTQNFNINLAVAGIIYDAESLELIEIDTETSSLSMAVISEQEVGQLEIIRGEPGDTDYQDFDDGYNGSDGNLVILKFKALKKGNAKIEFNKEKSSMLLDDGNGTEMNVELIDLEIEIK
ncbi:cohesin domain-containing protein [Candidatus Parcubacteria bacterium]|nr:cohesin domain-containing protein [Patescibacteria group bacterium]MCG2686973.1 cohesin domain-containing protein [Candidatus Parcubacteria bacterium]